MTTADTATDATETTLAPSNARGLMYFVLAIALTGIGLLLSGQGDAWTWIVGQIMLAPAFVLCFVLLHECGHRTLFASA